VSTFKWREVTRDSLQWSIDILKKYGNLL